MRGLLADLSLLGEMHMQTGCLILSDKSYSEESTRCSGNSGWDTRGTSQRRQYLTRHWRVTGIIPE